MEKILEKGTKLYEYFVRNGELRMEIVYVQRKWTCSDGEEYYYIETKERCTRKDYIQEIEKGIYQCPSWKDHFYLIKKNDKKALKLFIKFYKDKAEVYKNNLNNCLKKIKYLKFQFKEIKEEK